MARDDVANVLLGVDNGQNSAWKLKNLINGTLRRRLFLAGDVFIFARTADPDQLTVTVRDSNLLTRNVLGEVSLLLTYGSVAMPEVPVNEGFVASAYGRTLAFCSDGARMWYYAMYQAGPHHGPDEGGEGDPTTPPP